MPPPALTICHLSDLHLTSREDDCRSEFRLWGKLAGMNAAFRKLVNTTEVQACDCLVITGDITDRGELEAWRIFWQTLQAAGLIDRVLVLPGNHDTCHLGGTVRLGEPSALETADREKARAGLALAGQDCRYPSVIHPKPFATIFGIDSNNAGNTTAIHNGVGRLAFTQLLALAGKLHKFRNVPVKIVALHHSRNVPRPPTARRRGEAPPGTIASLTLAMEEQARRMLRLVCIAQGVRLIIHGHLHAAMDRRVNGLRIVGAPASTEPIDRTVGSRSYRFWRYTVAGKTYRVSCVPAIVRV